MNARLWEQLLGEMFEAEEYGDINGQTYYQVLMSEELLERLAELVTQKLNEGDE